MTVELIIHLFIMQRVKVINRDDYVIPDNYNFSWKLYSDYLSSHNLYEKGRPLQVKETPSYKSYKWNNLGYISETCNRISLLLTFLLYMLTVSLSNEKCLEIFWWMDLNSSLFILFFPLLYYRPPTVIIFDIWHKGRRGL